MQSEQLSKFDAIYGLDDVKCDYQVTTESEDEEYESSILTAMLAGKVANIEAMINKNNELVNKFKDIDKISSLETQVQQFITDKLNDLDIFTNKLSLFDDQIQNTNAKNNEFSDKLANFDDKNDSIITKLNDIQDTGTINNEDIQQVISKLDDLRGQTMSIMSNTSSIMSMIAKNDIVNANKIDELETTARFMFGSQCLILISMTLIGTIMFMSK